MSIEEFQQSLHAIRRDVLYSIYRICVNHHRRIGQIKISETPLLPIWLTYEGEEGPEPVVVTSITTFEAEPAEYSVIFKLRNRVTGEEFRSYDGRNLHTSGLIDILQSLLQL